MIGGLEITIFNKEANINEFISSQIKANKENLITELNALKKNNLFTDTNIKIDKYMEAIPTDNISNFINYRINKCHLFTMFVDTLDNNIFKNVYHNDWRNYLPKTTTKTTTETTKAQMKYIKYKTKYLRIKNIII
jgi:hypothetical protein